jgi:hypothetical protein
MANSQGITTSFKTEMLNGHHALGTCTETRTASTKDALKAALYLASATTGPGNAAYTATGEVSGAGYSAGGVSVTNATAPNNSGTTSFWTPSASISYGTVTLSTAFDAVMIYHDQFTTKRSVGVFTFGSTTVSGGTFSLTMPTNDASTGLVRFA